MLEFVVERLISLLGPIATLSKDRRELKDRALQAISLALLETKLYYRDRTRGIERSLDREAQLAKIWAEAAIPLRHIDAELAMICERKSDFWTGPDNWSSVRVKQLGIQLEDVTRAYRLIAMPLLMRRQSKNTQG
ncbi:hypothetical protein [Cupriavidus metallidurans]|jgi:hypothetical protein|uniref:Uncharacterized protein n=1 Tax=Cupriavidus metallidurans (strain ATCC 43123 / DSM 2839 / NBRC 102507 / CH34) TaxID=266264 RepID=Q1LI04_CUPMC|nr:hypothetical protein [Cupriavidus metallidurans]ABF10222.1 hypothetical protein Rmet_3350 [Cupriavidus metallidurans CH34]QGS28990.1 hypothetical protein FOB83_08820 [Cupriavidus metallidurans]